METTRENYSVVNGFLISAIAYMVITMLVGLLTSFQFIWPDWSAGIPFLSFGRIRPNYLKKPMIVIENSCSMWGKGGNMT